MRPAGHTSLQQSGNATKVKLYPFESIGTALAIGK